MIRRIRLLLRPLQSRDFRFLWLSMLVSLLGDGVYVVAIAWQTYELSNAPSALAFVGVVYTVPQVIFALIGGVASDRINRRTLLIWSDLARFAIISTIGAAAAVAALDLRLLSLLVLLYGTADAFYRPAFSATVPQLVDREHLVQANALTQLAEPVALRFVGPAVGGVLVAIGGASTAFLADGATFLISAALVLPINLQRVDREPSGSVGGVSAATRAVMVDCAEAVRFVRRHAWLWGSMLGAALSLLLVFGPFWVLVPFLIKNRLMLGAESFGLVMGVGGAGAVVAAVWASEKLPLHHVTAMYLSWAAALGSLILFGVASVLWQMMLASIVLHSFLSVGTIIWLTVQQRVVHGSMLGRVSGLDWVATMSLIPLSYMLTIPASELVGPRNTLIVAGVGGAAVMLALSMVPGVRALQRMDLDYFELPSESAAGVAD